MAQRAGAKLTSLNAGHAAMMAKPAEVAAVIAAGARPPPGRRSKVARRPVA
jgi:hypothetical protein